MSNKTHSPLTQSERMGQFRLKIIGSLLASPPEKGDLRNQLSQLTQKPWLHPISGESVHYSLPTLERWYYKAIKQPHDLLKTLSTQQRNDKGAFKSLNQAVCDALIQQYADHDGWSVQLHYDNLRVLMESGTLQDSRPSYASILRYMQAHNMPRKSKRKGPNSPGAR